MSRKGGLRDFMEGFNSAYKSGNALARDLETKQAMEEKPEEINAQKNFDDYNAKIAAQDNADFGDQGLKAAGSDYVYDANAKMPATQWKYNGKTYDQPIGAEQLDSLRSSRLADVAAKYGDVMGAMQLRAGARAAERENSELANMRAVNAENERFGKEWENMTPEQRRLAGIKQFNSNQGTSGAGELGAWTISEVADKNGMHTATRDNGDGTTTEKLISAKDIDSQAKDHLWENHVVNLARANPAQFMGYAMDQAKNNKHMQVALAELGIKRDTLAETKRSNLVGEGQKDRALGQKDTEIRQKDREIGNTAEYQKGVLGHLKRSDDNEAEKMRILGAGMPTEDEQNQFVKIQTQYNAELAKGKEANPATIKALESQAAMLQNRVHSRTPKGNFVLGTSNHDLTDSQKEGLRQVAEFRKQNGIEPAKGFFNFWPGQTAWDVWEKNEKAAQDREKQILRSVATDAQGAADRVGPGPGAKNGEAPVATASAAPVATASAAPSLAQARQAVAQDAFMKSYDPYGYGAQDAADGKTGLVAAYNYYLDPVFTRWGNEWDRIKHLPR